MSADTQDKLTYCLLCKGFFTQTHSCFNPISLDEQIKFMTQAKTEVNVYYANQIIEVTAENEAKYSDVMKLVLHYDHLAVVKELEAELSNRSAASYFLRNVELSEKLAKAKEALTLIDKFGHGVSIEKNLVVRNTATVVSEVLNEINKE